MQDLLTPETLAGNWGTLLLPIDPDGSINYKGLADEIDCLINAGIDGIYSNGTAGEFHNQTEEEFDEVQQVLSEKCTKASMRFQIGASHPSPVISLERIKRSLAWKPDAFQVILPDWVITGREEQVVFLVKLAEAACGVPLILYNPPHAKLVLEPSRLEELAEAVPQLIGAKVGMGNAQWLDDMRRCASRLSVFVPGHLLATGLREKVAAGAYSNVACLSPGGSQWWWTWTQADISGGLEVQDRIGQFFERCIVPFKNAGYSNPALDKFLAAVGGWSPIGTRLRWPYKWIDLDEVAAARKEAKKILPEFFIKTGV